MMYAAFPGVEFVTGGFCKFRVAKKACQVRSVKQWNRQTLIVEGYGIGPVFQQEGQQLAQRLWHPIRLGIAEIRRHQRPVGESLNGNDGHQRQQQDLYKGHCNDAI